MKRSSFLVILAFVPVLFASKKCTQYLGLSNPTGVEVDTTNTYKPKVTFPPTTKDPQALSKLSTKYDSKGLDAMFNLANSFMNTVQKKEFPVFKGADGKISFDDEIENLKKRSGKLYDYELPIGICFVIGILFALLMPLVGCCFCCCRLCGKCGGDMTQDDKDANAHFKCCIFALILFIVTIFMLTGALLMFVTSGHLKTEVGNAGKVYSEALNEATGYLGMVKKELNEITKNKTDCLYEELIVPDISDNGIKTLVGIPLKDKLSPHILGPLNAVKSASQNVTAMKSALDTVSNTSSELKSSASTLDNDLKRVKADLDRIKSDCLGYSLPNCNEIDTSGLKQEANFTNLPNVDSELSNIRSITNQNFSGAVDEATKVFNDIPDTVISKANSSLTDVRNVARDGKDKVVSGTDSVYSQLDNAINKTSEFHKYKKDIDEYTDYDKFRYYGFMGLSGIMMLIVALLAFGLTCGVCGYDRKRTPTNRSAISHHGGNMIMASVGFMFIFSFFLFFLTAMLFLFGEHMHIFCRELEDGAILDKYKDSLFDFNGTMENILKNCRANQAVYQAVDGKKLYDLEDKLNFTKIANIDDTLDKIKFDLSDQTVLNADTNKSLHDLKKSNVDNIDFKSFLDEVAKKIVAVDLNELAANLSTLAANMRALSNPNATKIANDLDYVAGNLTQIQSTSVSQIKNKTRELETNVNDLKAKASNISTIAQDIIDKLQGADNYVKTTAATDITNLIKDYTKRVLSWPEQFVNHILNELQTNIARCKPIANVYDGLFNTYICKGIIGNFNAFWISMGWCLFFFVFAIIFGVKLAKFLRRMKSKAEFDPYPGYEMQQHPVKIPLNELSRHVHMHDHAEAHSNRSYAGHGPNAAPPPYVG